MPKVSGKRVETPTDNNARIANNMFEFKSFLSKIPKIIGLKEEANVPTDEAIPPPIALERAG